MPANGTAMLISLVDILRVESIESLEHEEEYLIGQYPDLAGSLTSRAENGHLQSVLQRLHRKEKPDLVVMGTTGASGIKKIFFGTNTAAVLRWVAGPILAIPHGVKFTGIDRITLALPRQAQQAFKYPDFLAELISNYAARLALINVNEESQYEYPEENELDNSSVSDGKMTIQKYNIYKNKPVEGILLFLEQHPSDMLVMLARQYNILKKLFHHSHTREMAMVTQVPLLVLHDS
ncbi:MAG: universal stress protein [Owenweeksia sp.]|nr:universal stress protein [Owenweeksia sp.]